ncbi:MAG: hypothetical protein E7Z80_09100 [Methanobrevibacter thaueri]|nr:hypothetical protein [Methanobrevibacter thaueri]
MILVLIFGISASFAANVNQTGDTIMSSSDTSTISLVSDDNNKTLQSLDDSKDILSEGGNAGTFSDLNVLIKGTENGGTLTLDNNYKYNSNTDNAFKNGITISKPITINGNGYTIDGDNLVRSFIVNANNVILKNIVIINTNSTEAGGSINWIGNNGQLLNCEFNNSISHGVKSMAGFVVWRGSNGIIDNSKFNNGKISKYPTDHDGAGAVLSYSENLKILNSNFYSNYGGVGSIETTAASNNNTIYGCNFTNENAPRGGTIFSRRSEATLENCRFINCTGMSDALIYVRGVASLKNCYLEGNTALTICIAATTIDNCTFVANKVTHSVLGQTSAGIQQMASSSVITNCRFINETSDILRLTDNQKGVTLTNTIFENCSRRAVVSSNAELLTISDCTFKNVKVPNTEFGIIVALTNTNKTTINNCKFINCSGYKNKAIYLTANSGRGYANYEGNTFDSITTAAGTIYDSVNKRFTPYKTLYVEVDGTGTGTSKNSRTTLAKALTMIDFGGTIFLKKGTYNDLSTRTALYCNIVGEDSEVIINKGSFQFYPTGIYIENIIFNNTQTYFYFSTSNNKIIDCTFSNINPKTPFTLIQYLGSYGARNTLIANCSIINSNFAHFIAGSNNEAVTIDNLTIKDNSNFRYVVYEGAYASNNYKNINIINSECYGLVDHSHSPMDDYYQNERVSNVYISGSTITNGLIITRNSDVSANNIFNNIYLKDNVYSGTNSFVQLYYNNVLNNITLINLDNTNNANIFDIYNQGNSIADSKLEDLSSSVLFNSAYQYSLDNIIVNDVNANSAFTTLNGSTLNKLNFANTEFSECMGILVDDVELTNSKFTDFKGRMVINGNNVKVLNCSFTRGTTTATNTNGACIELVNGNQTFIQHCTFTGNSANRGGAIYINNVTNSSYIMYCDFSGNTATLYGGAIYIETGIYYYISDDTLATLSKTLRNNDLYKEIGVKETMSVVWVTVGGTGDGSFANPCAFEDSLDRVSPYGSIMFKGVGNTYSYSQYIYRECLKPGIKFMGNNSRINNLALIINELASEVELYNLIFENIESSSAIGWNGADGKIVGCTFRDNGGDKIVYGAALKVTADNLAISNSNFENNIAGNDSNAYGGAIYCNASGLTLNNCVFTDNTVYGWGSHIYLDEKASNVRISGGSKFTNGKVVANFNAGSAIYILSDANVTICNSEFTNNKAINGGALCFASLLSTVNIYKNAFTRNAATGNGGAIAFTANSINALSMYNNTYSSNTAGGYGGAIYSNVAINEENSTFTSNSASVGGAIYLNAAGSTIKGSTFSGNTANSYRNIYSAVNTAPTLSGNTFNGAAATLNTISNANYPVNIVLSGTFEDGNNFATNIPILANNNEVASFSLTNSNSFSVTWNNVLPDTYNVVVANVDNNGNKFAYTTTPSRSFTVSRRNVIYVGNTAGSPGYGLTASDPTTWDHVADILAEGGTVYFTSGTYSNFYDKTVSGSWTLRPVDGATVVLDANNKGRIFTVSANNVKINGLTFKNGKVSNNQGSAIYWTGTDGSITNSVFTENTGTPISSTKTISISNSQMKNQITLSKSNINWGTTETITGTFAHSAPSKVTILFNGASQGEYTVSSSKVTASYAFTNPATRSVGSYVVTDLKNNHKEVL